MSKYLDPWIVMYFFAVVGLVAGSLTLFALYALKSVGYFEQADFPEPEPEYRPDLAIVWDDESDYCTECV